MDSDTIEVVSEPTDTPTPTVTQVPTDTPTSTPKPTNTDTPTPTVTVIPTVTNEPTVTDTPVPTAEPTNTPTEEPTPEPTITGEPTNTPTSVPTVEPTEIPTDTPTPTAEPTVTDTPVPTPTVMTPPDYWAISQGDPDYGYKVLFQKDDWNCSGSAKLYDEVINVCPDINSATGYSYFLMPVEADDDLSFNAMYTVRMDYTDICADGIAFVLCSDMATNGPKGKYMGYGGVTPSLVVEMDNFKNDGQHKDENGEGDWVSGESSGHIAVMLDGNSLNHYAYAEMPSFQTSGVVYDVWVSYDGQEKMLYVWIAPFDEDGNIEIPTSPALTLQIDLEEHFEGVSDLYFGFTSATATFRGSHNLLGFALDPDPNILSVPTVPPVNTNAPTPVPEESFSQKYAIYSQGDPQYNYREYFVPELWKNAPDTCGVITQTYLAAKSQILWADASISSTFYKEVSPDYSFTMRFTYSNPLCLGNADLIKIKNSAGQSLDIQIDISKSQNHKWKDPYGQGEWQYGTEPYNAMVGINLNSDGMTDYAMAEYLPFLDRNSVHEFWLEYDGQEEMLYVYVATYDENGNVTKPSDPTLMLNISLEDLFEGDHKLYIETDLEMGVHSTRTYIYVFGIEFDPYPEIHKEALDAIEIFGSLSDKYYEVGDEISILGRVSPDIEVDTADLSVLNEDGEEVYQSPIDITSAYDEIARIDTTGWTPGEYTIQITVTDISGEEYIKDVTITLSAGSISIVLDKAVLDGRVIDIYGSVEFSDGGTYVLKYFDLDECRWKTIVAGAEGTTGIIGSMDLSLNPYKNLYVDVIAISDSGVRKSLSGEFLLEITTPTPTVTPTVTPTPYGEFTNEELFADIEDSQDGEDITFITDIIGTVSGTELQSYTLAVFPVDSEEAVYTFTNTNPVDNATVGTIDPTLLMNGYYKVVLTAYAEGGYVWDEVIVLVTGQAKVGNFTISFLDMTLPVAGLPVEVYRTYDSRQRTINGDFGYGWTMSIGGPDISISTGLGEEWGTEMRMVLAMPMYYWAEVHPHEVYIDWGNGHEEVFKLVLSPESTLSFDNWVGISATFQNTSGTGDTLEILDGSDNLIYADNSLYTSGLQKFDPQNFLLTRYDGMKFYFNKVSGLYKIEDTYGRTIEITEDGVFYSDGSSISFIRNEQGQITSITDGTYTVTYTYDESGNLVSVVDKSGNNSSFTYEDHLLIGMINAAGTCVSTNEYDDDGRLISTTDAYGNTVTFDHDIDGQIETVTNRLGYTTVYTYNEKGNVLTVTDGRGNTTTYTYDSNNNKISETDPLGNTITYSYDANNNLTSATNGEGISVGSSYSTTGQVTSVTLGGTTALTLAYDSYGNLSSATDALGNTQTYSYSSDGKLTGLSDSIGDIVNITYDSNGNATSITNAAGMVTSFTYDEYGRAITSTTTYQGQSLTDTYTYDANNNVTKVVTADGTVTSYTYDAFGNMTSATDAFGTTNYSYDIYGNLTSVYYPDGTTESFTYDAENQVISSTNRYGKTSTYSYDAVGNLKKITYSNGTTKTYVYDACNNVTSVTGVTGTTTTYEYDSIGRNTAVINDDGNETDYTYNSQNLVSSMTDCNGNTYIFSYDDAGNMTGVSYPNGGSYSYSYDVRGRLTETTDALGNTTSYSYDNSDNLICVTDALGNTTSYTYDIAGNLISITDAMGNETTYAYDGYGRIVSETNALGQTASITYNSNGQIATATDFAGNTITYSYDSLGRVTAAVWGDQEISYTYDSYGNVLSVGNVSYTYNSNGLLSSKTNGQGNEIDYAYNSVYLLSGITTDDMSVSYGYDKYGRMESVTDGEGQVTTYTYDNVGNVQTVSYPNGVVTTYGYDNTNLIISIYTVNAAGDVLQDYSYTRDLNGNITEADEGARTVYYEYDALGRLTKETVEDVSGTHVTEYSYDANSNRISKTVDGVVTTYTYNELNQLVQAGDTTYTYDNAGNLVSQSVSGVLVVAYEYDEYNRLISVTGYAAGNEYDASFTYDDDGSRKSKTFNGTTTYYITDSSSGYSQVLKSITGGETTYYVRGFDLISSSDGTDTNYYLTDVAGSIRCLTDESGNVTDAYVFDSFGNVTEFTGTTDNNYGFQGEEQDETGLVYLRARYMDPETGRFLSMDSYGGNLSNPISQNRYLFANSNPVKYKDPSGHFSLAEMDTAMAINYVIDSAMYSCMAYCLDTWVTDPNCENHSFLGCLGATIFGVVIAVVFGAAMLFPISQIVAGIGIAILGGLGIVKGVIDIINGYGLYGSIEILLSVYFIYSGIRVASSGIANSKTNQSGYVSDGANSSVNKPKNTKENSLSYNGDGTWTSNEGVVYEQGSLEGNRVQHILTHLVENYNNKTIHTVFNCDKSEIIALIDEAYVNRGNGIPQTNTNIQYNVDMGMPIGTNGESTIRLIMKSNDVSIVTAFPV
ncbi:RHS repeat-associated core domain-containing protein [Pseudobutyrivibrio sp.]|uniref:RHS repeat-associated core domain-containing protein n=1 Tax=Pseudobutyrivibrio sp. TaxID=2014367 RepID=UPI0025E8888D|nr:RHS repeat-associated core domain-containing protein [Pseudobutyrivibrio sp.]